MVSGLRLGADDYLTKDVSLPQLLARIAALFRRVDAGAQAPAAEDLLHRGRLALDAQAHDGDAGSGSPWTSPSPSSGWCIRSRAIPAT